MTRHDLTDLMEEASEHVYAGDLSDQAWSSALAHRRRRRRRLGAGVAAAAAVGVLGYTVGQLAGDDPAPPRPAQTSTSATRLRGTTADGTPFTLAPDTGDERFDPHQAGSRLPVEVRLGDPAIPLSTLPTDAVGRKIRVAMVSLRALSERELRPVLVALDGRLVEVDQLTLEPVHDAGGNLGSPLSTDSVTSDGHRVVFAQPGEVVVLDAYTGSVRRVPVPSKNLERVGWSGGRVGIVASDAGSSWFVDATTYAVTPLPARASSDHYRIVADATGERPMALQTWDAYGRQSAEPVGIGHLFTEVFGETVSSLEGRAAVAVFVDPARFGGFADSFQLHNALLVVQADHSATRTVLAFPEDARNPRSLGCCVPLTWAEGGTLLYLSTGIDGTWVMSWNTVTGDVRGVTRLVGVSAEAYRPVVALGLLQ